MSYNSYRPSSSYSAWELASLSFASLLYYGFYAIAYLFWFLPRSWFRPRVDARKIVEFEKYADHYYARPEFAYFKADEGRCFREHLASVSSPSVEIGYEDGRLSSYHTDGHVFDVGLEYDLAMIGRAPPFPNYRQIVAGRFEQMPFADYSIGSIVAIHVLDHVADLDASLGETSRVLRPGGQLLFSLFSHRAPAILGSKPLAARELYHFLDQTAWRTLLAKHQLQLKVYREFTFSPLYLRIYFLGMRGLIPHDRSLVFRLVGERAPFLGRALKAFLKRVTYAVYWPVFNRPAHEVPGCNVFIVAQKDIAPGQV